MEVIHSVWGKGMACLDSTATRLSTKWSKQGYTLREFISYSSGGRRSEIGVTARSGSGGSPPAGCRPPESHCILAWKGAEKASFLATRARAPIPLMKAPPSWPMWKHVAKLSGCIRWHTYLLFPFVLLVYLLIPLSALFTPIFPHTCSHTSASCTVTSDRTLLPIFFAPPRAPQKTSTRLS